MRSLKLFFKKIATEHPYKLQFFSQMNCTLKNSSILIIEFVRSYGFSIRQNKFYPKYIIPSTPLKKMFSIINLKQRERLRFCSVTVRIS